MINTDLHALNRCLHEGSKLTGVPVLLLLLAGEDDPDEIRPFVEVLAGQ